MGMMMVVMVMMVVMIDGTAILHLLQHGLAGSPFGIRDLQAFRRIGDGCEKIGVA